MPKINAPTVREHRSRMEAALVDAAEQILRDGDRLTISAVAARVGLARSGVYKYVSGVEGLIEAVVARGFPPWVRAVRRAVDAAPPGSARVIAYARANIAEGVSGEHRWHVGLAASLSPQALERVMALHADLETILEQVVRDLGVRHPDLLQAAVHSLVDTAIRAIDTGKDPQAVTDFTLQAVASLTDLGQETRVV